MQRNQFFLLCTMMTLACDVDDRGAAPQVEGTTTDEVVATDDGAMDDADDVHLGAAPDLQAVSNSDPLLKWALDATTGTARLMRRDPVTGVISVAATHVNAPWTPVSVAGNKLLWQRYDTGAVSLWTLNNNGALVSSVSLTMPGPGWKARSIALDQDGMCPPPTPANSSYTVLLEGPPPQFMAQWPRPILRHINDAGVVTGADELLPDRYPDTELRDFRTDIFGYAALVTRPLLAGTANIVWYGRSGGALQRLRTYKYTATAGLTSCIAHTVGDVCPAVVAGQFPGAGYSLASFLTTASVGLQVPASYLLWTKTDGSAKAYLLGLYNGQQYAPAAPIVTGFNGTSVASFAGAQPEACPVQGDPQDPPADMPGEPTFDPPGCPEC